MRPEAIAELRLRLDAISGQFEHLDLTLNGAREMHSRFDAVEVAVQNFSQEVTWIKNRISVAQEREIEHVLGQNGVSPNHKENGYTKLAMVNDSHVLNMRKTEDTPAWAVETMKSFNQENS